jgi:hypothetical protein
LDFFRGQPCALRTPGHPLLSTFSRPSPFMAWDKTAVLTFSLNLFLDIQGVWGLWITHLDPTQSSPIIMKGLSSNGPNGRCLSLFFSWIWDRTTVPPFFLDLKDALRTLNYSPGPNTGRVHHHGRHELWTRSVVQWMTQQLPI